jgi:hypothetical protein
MPYNASSQQLLQDDAKRKTYIYSDWLVYSEFGDDSLPLAFETAVYKNRAGF